MNTKFGKWSTALCHFFALTIFEAFSPWDFLDLYKKEVCFVGLILLTLSWAKQRFASGWRLSHRGMGSGQQQGAQRSRIHQVMSSQVAQGCATSRAQEIQDCLVSLSLLRGDSFLEAIQPFEIDEILVFAVFSNCHTCTWKPSRSRNQILDTHCQSNYFKK